MNAAACSWRVKMSSIDDLRMDSTISRFSSPGIPKIRSTPSFSRAATSRSEALNMSCLQLGLVSFDHRGHAVEAEVELRHTGRPQCRAPTLLVVATINPRARQSEIV